MHCIILFTRYPQPGKVKTRLAAHLGPEGAAKLHTRLTEQIIRRLQPVVQAGTAELQVHYCGGSAEAMKTWLGDRYTLIRQHGDDLGERMANAFVQAWGQGAKQVLLIGSDCPDITAEIITTGLAQLNRHDLVLGPAADGGYYLIGLKPFTRRYTDLFNSIAWSTGEVLHRTVQQAEQAGISYTFLPKLHDIDRVEDLVHFHYHPGSE